MCALARFYWGPLYQVHAINQLSQLFCHLSSNMHIKECKPKRAYSYRWCVCKEMMKGCSGIVLTLANKKNQMNQLFHFYFSFGAGSLHTKATCGIIYICTQLQQGQFWIKSNLRVGLSVSGSVASAYLHRVQNVTPDCTVTHSKGPHRLKWQRMTFFLSFCMRSKLKYIVANLKAVSRIRKFKESDNVESMNASIETKRFTVKNNNIPEFDLLPHLIKGFPINNSVGLYSYRYF